MSSLMLRRVGRLMAMMLVTQGGVASTSVAEPAEGSANRIQAEVTRTAKERLGGKASDEQRVDNCKVPVDLRGAKPRPDCKDEMSTGAKR